MQNSVRQVVEEIGTGLCFDSHFVISQIIKRHSDAYIHFAGPETTAQMHGRIAQLIDSLPSAQGLPQTQMAWSEHIHGMPSPCRLWQRI